jgi:predicted nucleotidyltransferase
MEVRSMNQTVQQDHALIIGSALIDLCRRYGIKERSVGSAARGEMGPQSDIDLMVEFQPGVRIGLVRFEHLVEELELLARRRVDLVTKRGLKPWVRPHALKDARVIYAAA